MANVFPFNSSPINVDRCHAPVFKDAQAFGILLYQSNIIIFIQIHSFTNLANEQIKAHVCSAAESVFPPGVLQ